MTFSLPLEEPVARVISRFRSAKGLAVLTSGGVEPCFNPRFPLARWSFIATDPFMVLSFRPGSLFIEPHSAGLDIPKEPFQAIESILGAHNFSGDAPTPFPAGGIGYFSYELRTFFEKVPVSVVDDLRLPQMWFCFYDAVVSIDHYEKRIWITSTGMPEEGAAGERRQQERFEEILATLRRDPGENPEYTPDDDRRTLFSSFSHAGYVNAVKRVKEYIAAGDVYQVNIAQRYSVPSKADGFSLFQKLLRTNPSPFAAYLEGEGFSVASCSPERFIHYDKATGTIHTRPIKGTRPRGRNPEEDKRLAEELLASSKDRAEHVMIVDLERNDLGRLAQTGSVRVSEFCVLEPFPTVFHLTSTVEAKLRQGTGIAGILRATFPGGSITGAPKVRAMEIIDEIEPVARGIYTGAIGYLSFNGRMDLNIVIRTLVLTGGYIHFHVGGGIVADSDPEGEYQETLDKGRAFSQVLGIDLREVKELEDIR
ncbi:MAG: aminodeoxychorismate synthase component I [Bacillota bacterium]